MLAIASAMFLGLLVLAAALHFLSPGKPAPLLDAAGRRLQGGIAEKTFVEINGVRQGMFIKSARPDHPVLLYLHGGMPDYFLTARHPTGFESAFTVVWWEQRGSGLSYSPQMPLERMTLDQLISDVFAVTDYLRQRFSQSKIYLMGHSGGTFIGIQAAARSPERYHAYVGVGQMSCQLESERLAWEYMRRQLKTRGDRRLAKKLEAAPVTLANGIPREYLAIRDGAMHRLGIGTMRGMRSLVSGLLVPSFLFREYTVKEKVRLWRAKSRSGISTLWDTMLETDLRLAVTRIGTPVHFLHGRFDYTVSYGLARAYFDVSTRSRNQPTVRCSRSRKEP